MKNRKKKYNDRVFPCSHIIKEQQWQNLTCTTSDDSEFVN